jgi:hypothetical protein
MPIPNMGTTSKQGKIKELKAYLNSFCIGRIKLKDIEYSFTLGDTYEIILYELNGEKVEIFISKKEPIIEIISKNKKRSYFIEEGYKELEFINEFGKSLGWNILIHLGKNNLKINAIISQ